LGSIEPRDDAIAHFAAERRRRLQQDGPPGQQPDAVRGPVAERVARRLPESGDGGPDRRRVASLHVSDLDARVGDRQGDLNEPQRVARGVDLPDELPVPPDRPQLERRPAARPPTAQSELLLWVHGADQGPCSIWRAILPAPDRQLEPSCLVCRGRVVRALACDGDEHRRDPGHGVQEQRRGDQRQRRPEDVEDGGGREQHVRDAGSMQTLSASSMAAANLTGPIGGREPRRDRIRRRSVRVGLQRAARRRRRRSPRQASRRRRCFAGGPRVAAASWIDRSQRDRRTQGKVCTSWCTLDFLSIYQVGWSCEANGHAREGTR
jgi:hypothetical protein